jgi:nucleotide-binding universal stress UspA family protein
MSDRVLKYAIYLSKISGAEIVILNIIDQPENLLPASAVAFFTPGDKLEEIKDRLQSSSKESASQILEERIKLFKKEGVTKVSFIIRAGKPVDEIVIVSEEMDIDLIVMASSRIASSVRVLGSNAKRVIDSVRKPVLIIHE